jgi:hypothetical protein
MRSSAKALPLNMRLALSPDEAAASLGVSRDFLDEHVAPELSRSKPWRKM